MTLVSDEVTLTKKNVLISMNPDCTHSRPLVNDLDRRDNGWFLGHWPMPSPMTHELEFKAALFLQA